MRASRVGKSRNCWPGTWNSWNPSKTLKSYFERIPLSRLSYDGTRILVTSSGVSHCQRSRLHRSLVPGAGSWNSSKSEAAARSDSESAGPGSSSW
jgi:hypothetical protein